MKRIVSLLILLSVVMLARATNTLTLSSASGHPGETVTLTLSMSNTDSPVAMQAMIPLGPHLSYVDGSCALVAARANGHEISGAVVDDTLRIYSYSASLNSYLGTSGALITFQMVLGDEPATYTLPIDNPRLSSSAGLALPVSTTAGSVTIYAPKIALNVIGIDYGRCPTRSSYTRSVTVQNVGNEPLVVSGLEFNDNTLSCLTTDQTIAAGSSQSYTVGYSPVESGTIVKVGTFHSNAHVGDSTFTVNANPYSVNELRVVSANGYTDSTIRIYLSMNNMDSIVGLQTLIKLPAALTYVPNSFRVEDARNHGHMATAGLSNDSLTLVVHNIGNRPFIGGEGNVCSFEVTLHGYGYYTLTLRNTVLADNTATNVLSDVYSGNVRIYSPSLSCASTLDMGTSSVVDPQISTFAIRNNGNAPLIISDVVFTQSGFAVLDYLPVTVANSHNATLHVQYDGTDEGAFSTLMKVYSNDPNRTMFDVTVTGTRYEPNTFAVSMPASVSATSSPKVDFIVDNYSNITAVQFDFKYPSDVYTVNSSDFVLESRCRNHTISAVRQNDSVFRVVIYSLSNATLSGNSGSIASVRMHPIGHVASDTYKVVVPNVVLGGVTGVNRLTQLDSIAQFAVTPSNDHTVTVTIYPIGDPVVTILGFTDNGNGVFTGSVADGGDITLSAFTGNNPNYRFIGWFNANTVPMMIISSDETYTLQNVTEDKNLYAYYQVTTREDQDYLVYADPLTKTTVIGVNPDYRGIVTNLAIPASVTAINQRSFENCTSLVNMIIPSNVATTGNYLFDGCTALTSVTYMGSTTAMGTYTFYGCNALQSVVLPAEMTTLPEGTFYGCSTLPTVQLPATLTAIGAQAFRNCTSVYALTVPDGVATIGAQAFGGMSALRFITLGSGTTTIGAHAFTGVSNLVHTNFAGTLQQWLAIDFADALANPMTQSRNLAIAGQVITDLVIPTGVTEIKKYAFFYDTVVTGLTLPATVTAVADSAFARMTNLTTVTLEGYTALPTFSAKAFDGVNKNAVTVIVPCTLLDAASSDSWCGFTHFRAEGMPVLTLVQTPGGSAAITNALTCSNNSVTITATPAPNYTFVTWSDGSAANPRTIDMTGIDEMTLSAIWERSTDVGPTSTRHFTFEGNTASGLLDRSSFYTVGDGANRWCVGDATANTAGIWGGTSSLYVSNDGGNHNEYSDASQTYTYAEMYFPEGYYQIEFDYKVAGNSGDNLTVALLTNVDDPDALNLEHGTVLYNGLYSDGLDWEVKSRLVQIAPGMAGWYRLAFFWNTDDNNTVDNPGAAIDNIFVTYQSTIGDRFAHVSVDVDDATMGRAIAYIDPVTDVEYTEHDYYYGQEIVIRAVANDNYQFVRWSDGSTDAMHTLSFEELWGMNMTYTAYFEAVPTSYIVSVDAEAGTEDKAYYGVVEGDNYDYTDANPVALSLEVDVNHDATIYAVLPSSGWGFLGWRDNVTGDTVRENPYTVHARNEDVRFTALIREYRECDAVESGENDENGDPVFVNAGNTVTGITVTIDNGCVVVQSVDGGMLPMVELYDATGRKVGGDVRVESGRLYLEVPASEAYLVKVGNNIVRRVVMIK